MSTGIKKTIKNIFRRFGFSVKRLNALDPDIQLNKMLQFLKIDLVFDIGANEGQFAAGIREAGYAGKIVSFEPLTSARNKLENLARLDSKWFVHPQSAIGAADATIEINISKNSVSSSVLPMLAKHHNTATESIYIGRESVNVITLDSLLFHYADTGSNLFIKIDTQGYETQVLEGAQESLKFAKGVVCELSLIPLYEDQPLWREIVDGIEKYGYKLWCIQPGFFDPKTGQLLQMDGFFLRNMD